VPVEEPSTTAALDSDGTKDMTESFLNCGNLKLEEAARE
jgi:hypothetical protein